MWYGQYPNQQWAIDNIFIYDIFVIVMEFSNEILV